MTQWFFLLLGDDGPDARFALVPPNVRNQHRIEAAQSLEIREPLELFSPRVSWAELLQSSADRGFSQLTQTLQINAPYLESDVLAAVSQLRTSEFLVMRLMGMDDYVSMNTHVASLRFLFVDYHTRPHGLDTGYHTFWDIVVRLDKLLERDTTRLQRAILP